MFAAFFLPVAMRNADLTRTRRRRGPRISPLPPHPASCSCRSPLCLPALPCWPFSPVAAPDPAHVGTDGSGGRWRSALVLAPGSALPAAARRPRAGAAGPPCPRLSVPRVGAAAGSQGSEGGLALGPPAAAGTEGTHLDAESGQGRTR